MEPKKWQVVGRRPYYWGFKIMKPGQVFTASEELLPAELRKMVVEYNPEVIPPPPPPSRTVLFNKYEKRETEYGWDIVDCNGKRVSENPLTEEQANEMLSILQG